MSPSAGPPSGGDVPRVVLVETDPALPGLLPFQGWDALALADVIYLRDPDAHPSAEHLWFAGLDLQQLEPAELDPQELDLSLPGSPEDRRLAEALLAAAEEHGRVVFLLGPDDDALARVVGVQSVDHDAEVEIVFLAQAPRGTELLRLVSVMEALRDPEDGCPWDLEQDHDSLTPSLLEETYELLEAIDVGDDAAISEELGDVLLQVVFHAQVAADRDAFGIDDVARGIADKLVRRHPHVFGDVEVDGPDEVRANWDDIKRGEKGRSGPFEGIPEALPALQLAQKQQRRARRAGFDPLDAPAERLREALASLPAGPAGRADEGRLEAAIGDLLATAVALARRRDVDAEQALRRAGERFRDRFDAFLSLAEERGIDPEEAEPEVLAGVWADTPEGSA